ncbi:PEP-utilizing enzyme [Paenibacillus dendritiformis]|uniref:PEP-utilizing enzyme n=1 Tax=Paenibacillus dendritiformis TaxID=130049 RepID=UPI000304B22E
MFLLASAVVSDSGGPLSHAAIVAREYRIPAVLGTKVATSCLKDGDRVIVDGFKGTVMVLKDQLAAST